jgi:colicin import membrane protein
MGPGLVLALFVHGLLVAALAFSVRWHASEPEGVEAELWAAVPQIAAPRAVRQEPVPVKPEPTPMPLKPMPPKPTLPSQATRDAQIAIDKARRDEQDRKKEEADKLAQKQRLEQEAKRKEEAQRKKQEDQKLAALREQNLKRMLGQAGATGEPTSTGSAEKTAGPSAGYAGRIKARIKPNIIFTDAIAGNPLATVKVQLAPDGTIIGTEWIKRSGVAAWDDAVMRAIQKTEVLPRDLDGRVPPSIEIDFRPRD